MKAGDIINESQVRAVEWVRSAFRAYQETPEKRGKTYRERRDSLDTRIRLMLETFEKGPDRP